ncbi:MAG: thermonuclease family protein [Acidobacteriota bacterium]
MKKRPIITAFVTALALTFVLPLAIHSEWVRVDRVIDGDTFVTSDGTKVRIRNIDTPETKHPTKGKEPGGEAATQIAKFFLEGNYVWLEGKAKDKYGRRLATVTLPGGGSYADIVRSHGYDKKSNSLYSYSGSSRYYLGGSSSQPKSLNPYSYPSSGMTWVNGYYRKDGTWVSGHWRRKSSSSSSSSSSYTVPSYSFGSSNLGSGKVRVRGYYRKDGTYVKPHYRSKPKR